MSKVISLRMFFAFISSVSCVDLITAANCSRNWRFLMSNILVVPGQALLGGEVDLSFACCISELIGDYARSVRIALSFLVKVNSYSNVDSLSNFASLSYSCC